MSFAVEIKNLRKQYKGAWSPALDGLSLTVRENQIMGLLGPNGAGKSTTINILCGLVQPDSGSAAIFDKDCVKDTMALRGKIGVVPQQIALFPNLTARENFMYIGRLYGLADAVIAKRAGLLLERLGLEKHADKRVGRYSGGMKRRANIIASLLHEPELIILDEPTAGVDVQSRAMILDFLQEYHLQGKTILYTSHLMDEAQKICDEVVIIDEGKYIVSGAPDELIKQMPDCKSLEEVFLHFTGHSVRD
ncbi:ABC transporter ATP-binding protein [Chitinophagaceae bacterium MMS25-I14]